ncbi:MAG: hypothetical protein RMK81_00700 [Geminicoccaceae bacterium]|nr:hypothetical protein [Geminicoccaceae bacterium]
MGSSAAGRGQRHGTDPLARGLRLVAFAAALSVLASILDGRLRGRPAEPGVLLPIPEAVEARTPTPSTTEPAAPVPPPEPPSAPEPTTEPGKPAVAPSPEPAPPVELPRAPSGTVRDGVLAYQAGDFARAFAIWRPLAEAGNARAQFHLGALYLEGRIGPPDYALAYRWLALAARAGQAAAAPLRDQAAARLPAETLAAIRRELGPDP